MVPPYRDIFEVGNDPMDAVGRYRPVSVRYAAVRGIGAESAIPDTTIYGECDFTEPGKVRRLQAELGVPETSIWDEATCAAWHEKMGRNPTPEDLEQVFFKMTAYCGSATVPVCGAEEPKKLSAGKVALIGLVVTGVFVLGYMARRRRR